MTASPSQINAGRTLAGLLSERGRLDVVPAQALIWNIARQLGERHALGMIHGAIALQTIQVDDPNAPRLAAPAPEAKLRFDDEWAASLPELSKVPPLELPAGIDAVR